MSSEKDSPAVEVADVAPASSAVTTEVPDAIEAEVVYVNDVQEVYAKIDPPKRSAGKSVLASVIATQNPVYTSEDEQRDFRAGKKH